VQTSQRIVERCLLMTTDPGDLVLDPTCGSGTTAFVAEQWGRRWITCDTSRVALALARTRVMASRHPAYLLRDSKGGAEKEAELTARPPADGPFHGDIRQGFVLARVPHITLKGIANNAEIDLIQVRWQPALDAARAALNATIETAHEEWQVPRALPDNAPAAARDAHTAFWKARRSRQSEMDASIARNADVEYLHDRPYPKKGTVRVTGPFTVESLSPHRVLPADEEDEAVVNALAAEAGESPPPRRRLRPKAETPSESGDDFVTAVLDNLLKAGVQNTKKGERLTFVTVRRGIRGGRRQEARSHRDRPRVRHGRPGAGARSGPRVPGLGGRHGGLRLCLRPTRGRDHDEPRPPRRAQGAHEPGAARG